MTKYLICLFVISVATLYGQDRFEFEHQQMGTQIRLVCYTSNQKMADSASNAVFTRIDDLNSILSDYLVDSELNKLCRETRRDVVISDDLYKVMLESVEISKTSTGAYDITAGAIIRLWRAAKKSSKLPTDEEIKQAMGSVGYQNLTFKAWGLVRLEKEDMQLDLGGIGKGFAADEALKILHSFGLKQVLIDMGGDIVVGDPPPQKEHWTLAFYYYDEDGKEVTQKLALKNQAVATSGDLYQFMEIDGIRYSHIVDPKTGMALQNNIQVTTIAPNATMADGYASALSVMGIAKAPLLVDTIKDLEAFMVQRSQAGYSQWNSKNFLDATTD